MINVALLSKWHVHAEDYAKQATKNELLSIQMVWDEDEKRGREWAEQLGVPFEPNLLEVLANSSIDAVIVNTPTNLHKEVIIAAAKQKKHIFTEKVLALSTQDCDEIFAVVEETNVQLMVSLPRLTEPYYLYAQEVVDQGLIGSMTGIRCRLAHNGAVPTQDKTTGWLPAHFFNREQCGGGALVDLGAHPIYLTNRLAGKAKAVTARFQHTNGYEVEDNAVVLVEYESGALGTIETGFLSFGSPFQLEVYGTEGTLLIKDDQIRIKSSRIPKEGWVVPEGLPARLNSAMDQWVQAINGDAVPSITREDVRNLTLINEVSALSNEIGCRVVVSELENQ
ncbi:Gfo/Idh/MocA family protein [Neobacillus ginsengisoli]|uniref:Dehydrogenase n=1 Tax=Neobacillus ginsengisoli TaxID=904295 RepID=A0ABT9XY01_9BACI|nr:Gfo/Idh/MocA family oxidoreductase [Neobacillus ginsengisoli]MDQ0200263.1 putative dehydrogenase [Neobacillus ginsengisoli]